MNHDSQIIYKQLLFRHGYVQIPMIQRDFAQGRPAESTVRDLFLTALDDALRKPMDDPTLPLNLDFIYGSVEGQDKTRFLPLDGQQRLTTLFLLHWYLAWRDEEWTVFEDLFVADKHARFTYDVRPSSKDFFEQLVCFRPAIHPEEVPERSGPITTLITDQPWYFRRWRLDPTIQSVLLMLDAIHSKFSRSSGLFARLVDENHPAITFQLLDLNNFGLSDDLYIKMNARGKPLTPFETFKARYEDELKSQFAGETIEFAGQHFSVADYVARRMDTAWADLFWKLRDPKSHQYDDAFMNLARAVGLVTRISEDESYLDDVAMLRRSWEVPSYIDFHKHGWLDERFSLTLIHLLDSWSDGSGTISCFLPNSKYFDERAFFKKIAITGANLSYTEIIQFAAYVKFIDRYHTSIDSVQFQEWMRIVYNLSTNTIYNRPDDFRRSIRGLDGLLENAADILRYFAQAERVVAGFYEPQIIEEKFKAALILAEDAWRGLIDRAEYHDYFRGQIGFLLDFCGALAAGSDSDPSIWDRDKHTALQAQFKRYLTLAEKTFSGSGLIDTGEYRWQRALLSIGEYLLPRGRNLSFLVNTMTDETSWKRLLRGTGTLDPGPRKILKQLWDRLDSNKDMASQLESIIDTDQKIEAWREALIHCPEAFGYCKNHFIRKQSSDTILLLSRSQLNGYYAELFTYCLSIKLKGLFTFLHPVYQEVMDTYSEPYLQLKSSIKGKAVTFSVINENGGYRIQIAKNDCREITKLDEILKAVGYFEKDGRIQNWSSRSDIDAHLKALDESLDSEYSNFVEDF